VELDRLGRSVKEILTLADELHDRGVGLRVLTGTLAGIYTPTGEGKFFFTVMAAFADPDTAARFSVAHTLGDQPNEPLLFLRQPTTRPPTSTLSHRNPRLRSVLRRSLEFAA
jgi:hypothetical protein